MVVTVEQTFQHCPKPLVRSNLWKGVAAVGLKACRRSATSRRRVIRERIVPPSTKHTANAFRTSSTEREGRVAARR